MVIAAISLWVLRKNRRILISFSTELPAKDVPGVCSLALSQWLIDKLTAAASAAFAGFLDTRIFNRHLLRIRCPRTVYIFSRALTGA